MIEILWAIRLKSCINQLDCVTKFCTTIFVPYTYSLNWKQQFAWCWKFKKIVGTTNGLAQVEQWNSLLICDLQWCRGVKPREAEPYSRNAFSGSTILAAKDYRYLNPEWIPRDRRLPRIPCPTKRPLPARNSYALLLLVCKPWRILCSKAAD